MLAKVVYHYHFPNKKKRLYIRHDDVEVMYVLYQKKGLATSQITELYGVINDTEVNEAFMDRIQKRLAKLSEYGSCLNKTVLTNPGNILKRAMFQLKAGGYKVLADLGYISKEEAIAKINNEAAILRRTYSPHSIVCKEAGIKSLVQLLSIYKSEHRNELIRNVDLRAFHLQENIESVLTTKNPYNFIPDVCMSFKNRKLFIEVDMLTGKVLDIVDKISGYINYAKTNPNQDIHVIFTTVDNSIVNSATDSSHYRRMSNLLFSFRKYHEQLVEQENLNIYMVSLSEVGELGAECLMGKNSLSNDQLIENLALDILEPLKNRTIGDSTWRYGLLSKIEDFHKEIDGMLRRYYKTDDKVFRDFSFIIGHENSYKSIARIDDLLQNRSYKHKDNPMSVIVFYPKRDKTRTIHLMDTYDSVHLFSLYNDSIDILSDESMHVRLANSVSPEKRELVELY
ncbi:replication-relaxation family protein [Bacillus cereus]|uniref:replication-relaxation family protein n=1 Tax=Bacillus cereus TaxID=1396 RepID=UPI001879C4D4|nr:replication-relaxation family protein [Bacillus cereus]MBE7123670.1 hypothetical protein [Bacillus cereus]